MPCYLTIISETGFPHSAVLLEVDGKKIWMGFTPKSGSTAVGRVSFANRERFINHYVRFQIPCHKAREVINKDFRAWDGAHYFFGFQDCVSFAADVARTCGLSVNYANLTPYGLVASLAGANTYTHYDDKPYPWNAPAGSSSSSSGTSGAAVGAGPVAAGAGG